jgi:hypothetical protein
MVVPANLHPIKSWNCVLGCALDDQGNAEQLLEIDMIFEPGAIAESATITFLGERDPSGIGSLAGNVLQVQPDPGEFQNYWNVLHSGRRTGAYIAADDQGNLLSFLLAFFEQ